MLLNINNAQIIQLTENVIFEIAEISRALINLHSSSSFSSKFGEIFCSNEKELVSVASMLGVKMDVIDKGNDTPFIVADLPSENDVKCIASRSFLLKSSYEYLSDCWSIEELINSTAKSIYAEKYMKCNDSFMIRVKSNGLKQTHKEVLELVDYVVAKVLKLEGTVNLSEPRHRFDLLLDRDPNARNFMKREDIPTRAFLGRWIADGQRKLINNYDLKARNFIANTSMDPLLSFIMANEAQVRENSLVLDPFCGSGGCMLACAHFGAYVIGADINYLLLHGRSRPSRKGVSVRSPGEGILANMKQYGLENRFLDCFVGDASLMPLLWHEGTSFFDAIVTDPPYGVRESGRKLGSHEPYELTDDIRGLHIPSKICYGFTEIYSDLLNLAATLLRTGGRLVFWLPSLAPRDFKEAHIPGHPCLDLIGHAPEGNRITTICRRLVTMQKMRDPLPGECAFIRENPFDTKTYRSHVYGAQPPVYSTISNSNEKNNNNSNERSNENKGDNCSSAGDDNNSTPIQHRSCTNDKVPCCRVHKRIMHKEASSS